AGEDHHRGPHRHHRHGAGEGARAHHDPRPEPSRAHGGLRPHRTPHSVRWWPMKRFWNTQDRGSATAELALLTPLLILIAVLVLLAHRIVSAGTAADAAAAAAARAATLERTPAAATQRPKPPQRTRRA